MSFDRIDAAVVGWMKKYGIICVRMSFAVIFIWFGALKPFGISPAENLAAKTIPWIPKYIFIPLLGWWEVAIGVCFLFRPLTRLALILLFLHMPGTMLPLIILPEDCYTLFPFGLTLEAQYIIKNLMLISAALVVGGSLRD